MLLDKKKIKAANKQRAIVDKRLLEKCCEYVASIKTPVVMDVGAHRGGFLSKCHEANEWSVSYAIEPIQENIDAMRKKLFGGFLMVAKAVASHDGMVKHFYISDNGGMKDCSVFQESVKKLGHGVDNKILFHSATIPHLLKTWSLSEVDLMMMNCEGSEYDLLLKNNEWIPKVKMLYLSMHTKSKLFMSKKYLMKRIQIVDTLKAYGFKMVDGIEDLNFISHITQLWQRK